MKAKIILAGGTGFLGSALADFFATKGIEAVILVLGGMHFFNMFNFSRMRKRAIVSRPPPLMSATTGK